MEQRRRNLPGTASGETLLMHKWNNLERIKSRSISGLLLRYFPRETSGRVTRWLVHETEGKGGGEEFGETPPPPIFSILMQRFDSTADERMAARYLPYPSC